MAGSADMPTFLSKNDKGRSGFGSCMAVAIMIGPSLAYGSPACMTQSEARTKFPKAHLYWYGRERCWNDSAAFSSRALAAKPVPSPQPAPAAVPASALQIGAPLETILRGLLPDPAQAAVSAPFSRAQAAVPAPSSQSALAAVPMPPPRPKIVEAASTAEEASGSQCRYSPCE
jgi:hypothetical protein